MNTVDERKKLETMLQQVKDCRNKYSEQLEMLEFTLVDDLEQIEEKFNDISGQCEDISCDAFVALCHSTMAKEQLKLLDDLIDDIQGELDRKQLP